MKKINKLLLLGITLFCFLVLNVDAASFSITAGTKNLTKGGKTTLKITGVDAIGRFNISTSNSSVVSISEGYVWVEKNTVSINLNALKTGTAKITVTAADVSNGSGSEVSLGSKSVTITVSLPREKSSNNYLKSLSVEGFELIPGFDKDTLEYNVSVPATTDKVKINAAKEDNYASVSGTGEFLVNDGINTFEVKVTSETGAVKVYSVNVTVEDLNPIVVKTVDNESMTLLKTLKNVEMPKNYVSQSISIEGITIPTYYNELCAITLVGLKDDSGNVFLYRYVDGTYSRYNEINSGNIQLYVTNLSNSLKGYTIDSVNVNGSEFEAYKVSKNSKFAVIYGINIVDGKDGFYTYDIKNNTIQEYDSELIDSLNEKNTLYTYIIIACGAGLAFSLILNIILGSSNKKKNDKIKKYIYEHENDTFVKVEEKKEEIKEPVKKKTKKAKIDISVDLDDLPPEIPDEEAKISLEEVLKDAKEKKNKKNTKQ